jgi:DNA-binding response OmpR family regulator
MNKKPIKVLFVEDELSLAEIVKESLEHRGFFVTHASTVKGAIEAFYNVKPDVIVLDVMLPDGSGFDLAQEIRKADQETRIIFLTSKSLPQDVVTGFESGGNDYLKKPFNIEELIIRIKVLLSRNQVLLNEADDLIEDIQLGTFIFSHRRNSLIRTDITYNLTAKESELLKLLTLNKHQTIDRKTLLNHIWKDDSYFAGRSMDVFITKLRKYLAVDPTVKILNIRGIGYKLIS